MFKAIVARMRDWWSRKEARPEAVARASAPPLPRAREEARRDYKSEADAVREARREARLGALRGARFGPALPCGRMLGSVRRERWAQQERERAHLEALAEAKDREGQEGA